MAAESCKTSFVTIGNRRAAPAICDGGSAAWRLVDAMIMDRALSRLGTMVTDLSLAGRRDDPLPRPRRYRPSLACFRALHATRRGG